MIKNYQKFLESNQDIDAICKQYGITNYTINQDGTVDVDGNVKLHSRRLTKLPLKFGRVTGYFDCYNNQLTSLEGGPKEVGGHFGCSYNQLTSLIGGPEVVLGAYYALNNQINSFEGFPDDYDGDCDFTRNPVQKVLNEFKGIPDWKVIKYIIEFEAIWNGEIVPERLEMVKDKLSI